MALSLSAEQRELLKVFKIEEQYVIPSYQRPYSWEYDHCFQLYNDLQNAFVEQQDYFIGNIIIAKADNNKQILEVVDGQQRLITSLLLFKVLSLFQPGIKVLQQLIEKEDWEGENKVPRIRTDVFEADDGLALTDVLGFSFDTMVKRFNEVSDKSLRIIERKCKNRFECNLLYFYNWIKYFNENGGDLREFTIFVLQQVYLLPIELSGANQDEANEKALVIFETINNRGMNLEDADIFKAKLYNKAKSLNEEKSFIELWTDFKSSCEGLKLSVDDVFRYYSHVIRGKEGITSGEKNLREFFINEKFSPFETRKYKDVLDDLSKIIGTLEFLNKLRVEHDESAKWLQIIDAYTNQYPKYAIVNYLFVNGLTVDQKFINLLQSLTRYVYFLGTTTTVKFEIYNIIKQLSFNLDVAPYFREDVDPDYFNDVGRLKKGFALLAFYLNTSSPFSAYNVDKIINLKDQRSLIGDWNGVQLEEVVEKLGNFVVVDLPKKNITFAKKHEYYAGSQLSTVKNIFKEGAFTYSDFLERDRGLRNVLVTFFVGK